MLETALVRPLHAAVLHPHEVEAPVGKGQVERMPVVQDHLPRQAHPRCQQCPREQIKVGASFAERFYRRGVYGVS